MHGVEYNVTVWPPIPERDEWRPKKVEGLVGDMRTGNVYETVQEGSVLYLRSVPKNGGHRKQSWWRQ